MSSFPYSLGSSSSPSSGFRDDRFIYNFVEPCPTSPRKEDIGPKEDYQHNFESDTRHPQSSPTAIPLRNFLSTNPNFLDQGSSCSLFLDSYSSVRLASYIWEASIFNSLSMHFASVGMRPTNVVEELEQDLSPSSGPTRVDPEDGPNSHCINPSFPDELKKIIYFKVKLSFQCNYRVITLSITGTIDNPLQDA